MEIVKGIEKIIGKIENFNDKHSLTIIGVIPVVAATFYITQRAGIDNEYLRGGIEIILGTVGGIAANYYLPRLDEYIQRKQEKGKKEE